MLKDTVRHHGTFVLQGHEVWGELALSGLDTELNLRTELPLSIISSPKVMHGRLHDFTYVSCIDCVGGPEPAQAWNSNGKNSLTWRVTPHQILSGRSHFNPDTNRIREVWFSTGDTLRIFDDFDSFGVVYKPNEELSGLIPRTSGERRIPVGPKPQFAYFAGRCTLLEASLPFGKLEVQHWLQPRSDGHSAGVDTDMRIQVAFEPALALEDCLREVARIAQFLSLVAGRQQGVTNIQVALDGVDHKNPPLSVYWCSGPEQVNGQDLDTPSWRDIPLDCIRRTDEFKQVIERWFASDEHTLARNRLYACRRSNNSFDIDRLVAAANMFDLTKSLAVEPVSREVEKVRDECKIALKTLPRTDDLNSVIMALSRIGAPSLMKKVKSRAAVLRGHFGLENLDEVLRQAIKCRNYFVHGPGDRGFNFEVVQYHTVLLTETLEFVFAAAELIECGWAGGAWASKHHTGRHWFNRFLAYYRQESENLLSDLRRASGQPQL